MPLLRKHLLIFTATLTLRASAFAPLLFSSNKRRGGGPSSSLASRPPPTCSSSTRHNAHSLSRRRPTSLYEASDDDDGDILDGTITSGGDGFPCWNPNLRKQLAVLSSLGALETAYLNYDKLQYSSSGGRTTSSLVGALCSAGENDASSCGDVLHGPYASLHLGGLDVPLSSLGMAAYVAVFLLATLPLVSAENEANNDRGGLLDGNNRIVLLGGTTLMASFSVYLVSLLVGVLHASCPFCFVSAGLSVSMAALSWGGGMLPGASEADDSLGKEGAMENGGGMSLEAMELRKRGVAAIASSVGLATVAALGLFLSASDGASDGDFDSLAASSSAASAGSGTLLASAGPAQSYAENVPPRITTRSSPAALALASDLRSMDARMFGAFWCSHCYDQKQSLGREAMQSIPYVECDREGYNNQRGLCKEREVPGYPTWEIGGELFPGERSLEELREIVDDIKSGR